MKILDKYILKSYIITFTSVFVVLFFIFILQGIWLFISELAGKDLDTIIILKFLTYYAPNVVPLVLPLSVLLSSIMTFGSFAENYEFAAMKSSGISLQRAMKYLTVFILILSLVAFLFSNNIIPSAQYKFVNLRQNIVQQKPAMALAQGQFNQIGNTNIKIQEKSGDKGQQLKGITIHKISNYGLGVSTVIQAKNGILSSDSSGNVLNLELFDGNYYEDILPKKYEEQLRIPFAKSSFKKYVLTIDLGKLNATDVEQESVTNTNNMLNISELNITLDSLQKNYKEDIISFADNITQRSTSVFYNYIEPKKNNNFKTFSNPLLFFDDNEKRQILEVASNNISSIEFSIDSSTNDLSEKKKNINSHWTTFFEKFMLAFSCLLMFFIGAPLGAIIRKGGLGLPMVFAVLIFILFHFINTFGKKLAQEDSISPFLGTWMSSIILTPFAILLTYRATNDIGIMINFDGIVEPFKKILSNFKLQKNTNTNVK
ncbi:MAG TPA: permease [Flavobacterium sp.]|nr:permease [Flavobacterium sp.]